MTPPEPMYEEPAPPSGWALGGLTFAATILFMVGVFQVLGGLSAIAEDDVFVKVNNYAFGLDVSAWGWIHLLLGLLLLAAGWALFSRQTWGGILAITVAVFSAVENFLLIPYQPWWSLLIIGLDVWVIWAITRPGALRAA